MSGLRVDTSEFSAMCRQLSQISAASQQKILDAEVAKVLEAAVRHTPAAKVSAMRARQEQARYSAQPASLYTPRSPSGRRHRAGVKPTKRGFIRYHLANRYPAELWKKIVTRRKASLARKIRARGLARRSWLMIADALGLKIAVPSYVKGAVATTGKNYATNVSVGRRRSVAGVGITIVNSQPTVNLPNVGGAAALQKAINGRVNYFAQNLKRGVFRSAQRIAKAYPGVSWQG